MKLPQATPCSGSRIGRAGNSPLLAVLRLPSTGKVTLRQPPTGVDQLDDVNKLLEGHDGSRDTGDHPWPEAVELVRSGQFQSTGTPGAGEEAARSGVSRISRLYRGGLGIRRRLQKRGGKSRRGEREQVETNEEELVKGAADEKDRLWNAGQWSV